MFERVSLGDVTVLVGAKGGKYPNGNSILIEDDVRLLVDPSTNVVAAGAEAVGGVDLVVNSHAHEDHFAGNFLFPQAPLILHEMDAPAMASLEALLAAYGMDATTEAAWARVVVEQYNFRPRTDVRTVADGDVLDLGRTRVHFLHMPGHTAGHLCLLLEPEGVVFTGDLDLTWFGPYYGDATASLGDVIASLARLRALDGVRALVSFHESGIVRDDLVGAIDRYTDVLWQRDRALLELCRQPRTIEEIAERCIVYRKPYPQLPWQPHVEKVMMAQHAQRLIELGEMKLEDGRYRTL
ncbi:MAG TPA: MBL fold metallo-hydrolase [Candidatus Limnocylindrales bacterium]|nr:MBL fold metallo-hydrolase [Candidatus Limnocylindrales bacterium]